MPLPGSLSAAPPIRTNECASRHEFRSKAGSQRKLCHEVAASGPGFGCHKLPAPSAGDIFLDLEGDPFVGEGGLEYCLAMSLQKDTARRDYIAEWAFSRADEKQAFEHFVDFVIDALGSDFPTCISIITRPTSPARSSASWAATRPAKRDRSDAAGIVCSSISTASSRHGIRASVESYSIKKLEPLYGLRASDSPARGEQRACPATGYLELGDLRGHHRPNQESPSKRTTATIASRRRACALGLSNSAPR